jgi:signal transduction histidine kinase
LRVGLVVVVLALGVGAEWVSYETGELDAALADLVVGWALVGCGLFAWDRRRGTRVGPLMVATGVAWFVGSVAPAALFLHRGPLVHLLMSYPSGRVRRRLDRVVVVAAYVDGAIAPLARSPVVTIALAASLAGAAIAGYLSEVGPRRRARALPAAAAIAVALVLGFGALQRLAGRDTAMATLLVYETLLVGIAVGLLFDLLRGRWSQAAVTGLVVDLGGIWEPVTLRDRLARALGDSSLELGYWLGGERGYVDEAGRPLPARGTDAGRATTPIDSDAGPVAVLVHDRSALDDPALVEAVATATRIAVGNARLQADVRARVEQLASSRLRIVEAADAERRRLERELREGAEQRLAAVAWHIEALASDVDAPRARELLADVGEQLDAACAELTELANGIHPAALTTGGLAPALGELARRASVPVELSVVAGRFPVTVEAAVYFLCAEGLTNVAKYASASVVRIEVQRDAGRLLVEIGDDGVGGADPRRGSGLRGLADRVEALGGRLGIESPRGSGTRVSAEIPAE